MVRLFPETSGTLSKKSTASGLGLGYFSVGPRRMGRKGTSIVEVLVAIAILALITGATVLLVVQVFRVNGSARLKNIAARYAEEALEESKALIQASGYAAVWSKGSAGGTCYTDGTLTALAGGTGSCGSFFAINGTFSRNVNVQTNGSDQVCVYPTISYSDGTLSKTESLYTCYFNY